MKATILTILISLSTIHAEEITKLTSSNGLEYVECKIRPYMSDEVWVEVKHSKGSFKKPLSAFKLKSDERDAIIRLNPELHKRLTAIAEGIEYRRRFKVEFKKPLAQIKRYPNHESKYGKLINRYEDEDGSGYVIYQKGETYTTIYTDEDGSTSKCVDSYYD